MGCPKCSGFLLKVNPMSLRHVKAVSCIICGFYEEDGMAHNRMEHIAWVDEDRPHQGVVKKRNDKDLSWS